MNNIVVGVALIIGASWAWGSIGVMQRNYDLQKQLDNKNRQQILAELEVQNLTYQRKYFQSTEYQELAVRERLGLAAPGEKVVVLPPNSEEAKSSDSIIVSSKRTEVEPIGNLQQWTNFLFGGNRSKLE